jgi:hypothetical protein
MCIVSSDQQETQQQDRSPTEKPEVTEEHKERAKEIAKECDEDRPTVTLPGSDRTVAGTAVADWLDDEGNPKYGDQSKSEKGEGESKNDG